MAYNFEYPYTDMGRQNADWLINEMKRLSIEMEELAETVSKFDITRAEVEQMIADASTLLKAYTDSAIDSYDANRMRPYVQEMLDAFNHTIMAYIDAQDESYYISQSNRTDRIAEDLRQYIDDKVINVMGMYNPVTGEWQQIPDVIDYLVLTFHRDNALTAGEYDGYDLTANAYDSQLISAYSYDFDGKNQVIH